jgi:hypothetical protein
MKLVSTSVVTTGSITTESCHYTSNIKQHENVNILVNLSESIPVQDQSVRTPMPNANANANANRKPVETMFKLTTCNHVHCDGTTGNTGNQSKQKSHDCYQ